MVAFARSAIQAILERDAGSGIAADRKASSFVKTVDDLASTSSFATQTRTSTASAFRRETVVIAAVSWAS